MNIDCKNKTITCDCGHTIQIKKTEFYHCSDCLSCHFDCDQCKKVNTIPIGFNDFLTDEISKNIHQTTNDSLQTSDDFADIFFGKNQLPLTDKLINHLVKEKNMNREELIYMQREGAQYSVSRNSFIFPTETNF